MRDRTIRDFHPAGDTDVAKSIKGLRKAYDMADKVGAVPLPVAAVVNPVLEFTQPIRAFFRSSPGAHDADLRL